MFSKLSILTFCYNEAAFIADTIQKVLDTKLDHALEKEIIVVDNGSTNNSAKIIDSYLLNKSQGKKIKASEGFKAIWCIFKYKFFSRK